MNELALFAGAGGGILGGKLLGWRTVCAVEFDEHARNVLVARQNDGSLEPFPIWDDVRTFDGKLWRGRIDVISGGFPCQDISSAGKGTGIDGERSGLWREMARIIGEVRPRFVFIENSPMLRTRGLSTVLKDLAEAGYDARWGVFGACDVGAPHKRERMWVLAYSKTRGLEVRMPAETVQYDVKCGGVPTEWDISNWKPTGETPTTKPLLGRNVNGMAYRVDRIKRIGNGQVPAVVRLAWNLLNSGI
jgi:DNA (cytosine-5)-methyltransferase 1